MLKRLMCIAIMLCAVSPVYGQEICAVTPEGAAAINKLMNEVTAASRPTVPVQSFVPFDENLWRGWDFRQFPPKPVITPFGSDATPYMYGQVIPQPPREKETRFSWWGYGHDDLHAKDPDDPESFSVIEELESKFGKGKCCNGVRSGECRITKFEEDPNPSSRNTKRRVIIDGEACDVTHDTKFTALNSFKKPGFIVVCAAKTYRSSTAAKGNATCSTYCIGTAGGF